MFGNENLLKLLLSECKNCKSVEEETLFCFYQKDISRLLFVELNSLLSSILFKVDAEEKLSDDNIAFLNLIRYICKKHLENYRLNGKEVAISAILPELINENREDLYDLISKKMGEQVDLELVHAYKKELERIKKFEKKRQVIQNIYNVMTEFLFIEDRKKQEATVNTLFKKLGGIFLNYSYENSTSLFGEEEEDTNDTFLLLDFREKSQVSNLLDKISIITNLDNVTSSGYHNFDNKFLNGGFEKGRLYVFAGRPGHGKSALLLNFAFNASIKEKDYNKGVVVYLTLENSVEETLNRLLKMAVYEVEGNREAYKEYVKNKNKIRNFISKYLLGKNFIIKYQHPGFSTSDLLSWLSALNQKERIRILFVDYLSLLTSTRGYEQKRHELGQISLELKKICRIFNIPIVTAAQLNTAGYDTIPTLKNIDESRQIAQHADFIGLLFDDKESMTSNLEDGVFLISINVDKNRSGPRGIAKFIFDSYTMRFTENNRGKEQVFVINDEEPIIEALDLENFDLPIQTFNEENIKEVNSGKDPLLEI